MNPDWLSERLASIERRLATIERHVGIQAAPAEIVDPPAAPIPAIPLPSEHLPAQPPPLPQTATADSLQQFEPEWVTEPPKSHVQTFLDERGAVVSFDPMARATSVPPKVPVAKAVASPGFEQTIGLKWAGWVGAVVLTIGAALGIKFAYDQGWLGRLPDELKLGLMSLAGAALLVTGEVVYRRVDKVAAAALFGAGVAIFFLVSFAGFNYYHLYERDTAFILMGISTLVGAAVALRGGLVSIAVLSLIGGNIAPIALRSDAPRLIPFLSYLLMLQVVALALCIWGRGARWWTLRGFSLATTAVWMAVILFTWRPLPRGWDAALFFTLLYAALYHIELLISARIFDARVAQGDQTERVSAARARAGMFFAMLVTAFLEGAMLWLFRHESQAMRGTVTLALGAAAGFIGWLLASRNPGPARTNHSIGYRIQAAALLVVSVPVALSGVWVVLAWAGLAIAFAVLGAALDLSNARRAAVVTWFLGLLYLAAWVTGGILLPGVRTIWLTLSGVPIPAFAILAWLMSIIAHAIAALIQADWTPAKATQDILHEPQAGEPLQYENPRRSVRYAAPEFTRLARGLTIFALLIWAAAALMVLPHVGATFMLILYVWLLMGAQAIAPRLPIQGQALTLWILTALKWFIIDGLLVRLSPEWSATEYLPIANPLFLLGLFLAATAGALYYTRSQERDLATVALPQRPIPLLAIIATIALLLALVFGFEVDRVVERAIGRLAWNSTQLKHLLWTPIAMASACLVLAAARRHGRDRQPMWARDLEWVPLLIAAKYLLIDTLLCRAMYGAALATPILNFETFTGILVAAGIFYALKGKALHPFRTAPGVSVRNAALLAIVMIVLWSGSLEIDRAFSRMSATGSRNVFTDPARAEQVALSIFWSLFAVAAVIAGFRFRTAGLRYFGLGLFAVTLLKVVAIDMSQVQTGYRILSFLGLGALLMGTSVLYGKLSPKLLAMAGDPVETRDGADGNNEAKNTVQGTAG